MKDAIELPCGLTGRDDQLFAEQIGEVEKVITEMSGLSYNYTETKKSLDSCLRDFVKGPLADTIKIA